MNFFHVTIILICTFTVSLSFAQDVKVFDLSNKLIFGKNVNGQWKTPSKIVGNYKVYRRDMAAGSVNIRTVSKSEEPCAPEFDYSENFTDVLHTDYIAVNGTWNHLPRTTQKVNTKNPIYTKAVQDWSRTKKLSVSSFEITEAFQVDIDNDNISETIIVASNMTDATQVEANNFSVILVQKGSQFIEVCSYSLNKDEAKNCSEDMPCFGVIHRFVMCLDINGDGILEIINAEAAHEGMSKVIYQWKNNKFEDILSVGCGV